MAEQLPAITDQYVDRLMDDRLTYLAFTPDHCSHCGADFNAHIPGRDYVYYCPEWALRQKWGDR